MTTTTQPTAPTPGLPTISKKFNPEQAWILYFLSGSNLHPQQKVFCYEGDIRKVVDRAKSHCINLNLRFLRVLPWLSDLDHDERFVTKGE